MQKCLIVVVAVLPLVAAPAVTYPVPSINLGQAYNISFYRSVSGQIPANSAQNEWTITSGDKTGEVPGEGRELQASHRTYLSAVCLRPSATVAPF